MNNLAPLYFSATNCDYILARMFFFTPLVTNIDQRCLQSFLYTMMSGDKPLQFFQSEPFITRMQRQSARNHSKYVNICEKLAAKTCVYLKSVFVGSREVALRQFVLYYACIRPYLSLVEDTSRKLSATAAHDRCVANTKTKTNCCVQHRCVKRTPLPYASVNCGSFTHATIDILPNRAGTTRNKSSRTFSGKPKKILSPFRGQESSGSALCRIYSLHIFFFNRGRFSKNRLKRHVQRVQ